MAKFQYDSSSRSWEKGHIRKCTLKFWPRPLKGIGKIWKNAQSLPFDRRRVFTTFQKFSSRGRLTIKCSIWTQNTYISAMPLKKKPRRDISGLKNQPKLTKDSSHTNEPMSCASDTVNKMTLRTKFMCSKAWFGRLAMNVFSYPKFHCELNPIEMVLVR